MPVKTPKGILPKSKMYDEDEKAKQKKDMPIKSTITTIEYKPKESNIKKALESAGGDMGKTTNMKEKTQERLPQKKRAQEFQKEMQKKSL